MKSFYLFLEKNVPAIIKNLIPEKWRIRVGYEIKVKRNSMIASLDYLQKEVVLPKGETHDTVFDYLDAYYIEGEENISELKRYLNEAFYRFVYTLELVPEGTGKLLEVGANPYFISLLLHKFTELDLFFTNFFGDDFPDQGTQVMVDGKDSRIIFDYANVNVELENSALPWPDDAFDVVLLCEVIEHFRNDPLKVLLDIKRVLKPNGTFILTTPNVNRLVNVARMLSGDNIYSPYSGFGPYARHNREYNQRELKKLLAHAGFEIEIMFTSDIHKNLAPVYFPLDKFIELLESRKDDLGHYIFIRAINSSVAKPKKPKWLYKDYPPDELAKNDALE